MADEFEGGLVAEVGDCGGVEDVGDQSGEVGRDEGLDVVW